MAKLLSQSVHEKLSVKKSVNLLWQSRTHIHPGRRNRRTPTRLKTDSVFKGLDTSGMQGEIVRACSVMKIANGSYTGVANPPAWVAEDVLKNQPSKGRQVKGCAHTSVLEWDRASITRRVRSRYTGLPRL